jgi:hypothetical protein
LSNSALTPAQPPPAKPPFSSPIGSRLSSCKLPRPFSKSRAATPWSRIASHTNARKTGDYTGARAILERAIQLDTRNSHLRLAYQSLVRQAEDAAHRASLKSALDAARDALRQRNYVLTLELLEKVDLIEPGNLESNDLAASTRAAIAEEQRRKLHADIEDRLGAVVFEQDAQRVAAVIRTALETTPSDAVLLRFQAQIDSVLRDHETRRLVEDTIRLCSTLLEAAPAEALETVRRRLTEVPNESRLVALEARIQARIDQLSADHARAAVLTEANAALKQRNFVRAVEVLEQCKRPILTPEISDLLEFARKEAASALHQERLANAFTEASNLLAAHQFDQVVELLSDPAIGAPDPRLNQLLEQAKSASAQLAADQQAALHRIQPFVTAGCHEQVLALVQELPPTTAASPSLRNLLTESQNAWRLECQYLEALGQAYAALAAGDCELKSLPPGGLAPDTLDPKTSELTPIFGQIRKSFFARRANTVDGILRQHLDRIQAAAAAGQPLDPAPAFTESQKLVPFASDIVRTEWNQLVAQQASARKSKRSFAPNWKRS